MHFYECPKYGALALKNTPNKFWKGFPKVAGASVFIKPNLVSPITKWDRYSTTRVEVVELIVKKLLKEKAKRIVIGECGFKDQWEATMESTKYLRLLDLSKKVEIIPLQDGPNFHKFTLQRIPKGEYKSLYGVKFSNYLLECDMVINVPKMKVHNMSVITGAIKNMMGTMAQKGSMHPRGSSEILQKRLSDLFYLTSRMVDFTVMDGIIGAEYCEWGGRPVKSGVLISGTDQWAIDVAAAKLMGIKPSKVPYLRYINENFAEIKVPKKLIKKYIKPV